VYDLGDKLVFKSDIYYISRQFAKTNEVQEGQSPQNGFYQKELKGVIDINIGAEYRYSERLSAFLNLNNIANQRYYRWNNYPNQRFNLLAGLTWAF
jgi:outer membrane receptor protein involved in Fe transport